MKFNFGLMILGSVTMIAFARTPDGVEPADEIICDDYKGKAYGLCVSYCEAKDCDEGYHPGCEAVRVKFLSITGKEAMPCDETEAPTEALTEAPSEAPTAAVACPCWDLKNVVINECDKKDDNISAFEENGNVYTAEMRYNLCVVNDVPETVSAEVAEICFNNLKEICP